MFIGGSQLPGPLRKYERLIMEIIWELGVKGKADEFIREGKNVLYRIQHELTSANNEEAKNIVVYKSVKEHLLKFII